MQLVLAVPSDNAVANDPRLLLDYLNVIFIRDWLNLFAWDCGNDQVLTRIRGWGRLTSLILHPVASWVRGFRAARPFVFISNVTDIRSIRRFESTPEVYVWLFWSVRFWKFIENGGLITQLHGVGCQTFIDSVKNTGSLLVCCVNSISCRL